MFCVEDWLINLLSVVEGIFIEVGKLDYERVCEFFMN